MAKPIKLSIVTAGMIALTIGSGFSVRLLKIPDSEDIERGCGTRFEELHFDVSDEQRPVEHIRVEPTSRIMRSPSARSRVTWWKNPVSSLYSPYRSRHFCQLFFMIKKCAICG